MTQLDDIEKKLDYIIEQNNGIVEFIKAFVQELPEKKVLQN